MSYRYMNTIDLLKHSTDWEQSMRMMLNNSPKTVLTTADLDRIRGIVTDVTGLNAKMCDTMFYHWCAKALAPMGKSVAGVQAPGVVVTASANPVIPDDLVSSLEAAGYLAVFYDDSYNEVPVEKATKISVFSVKDWANDKVTIKIPKKNIVTFEYVMSKLSAGSTYKNFADTFKRVLDAKRQGNGLIVYPTTYGIGIFVAVGRRDSIEEIKAEVASTLEQYGIQYTTEYSDAGWVFRYRIGRSADNLAKIEQINLAVTASLKIGDATSHGIIEDETDTQWLINDKWVLKSLVNEGNRPDIATLKANIVPSSVPAYLVDKTLEDVIKFGIPVDSNGNITLYHGTSPKNAALIAKNGLDPWSYLSTSPSVSRRFGSKVINIIANPSLFVSHGNSIQVSDPALTLQNMDRLYPRGNVFGLSASVSGSPSGRSNGISFNDISELEKEAISGKVASSSQSVSILLKCPNKTALAFVEDLFESISLYNTGMSRDIRVVYNKSSDDTDPKSQVLFFDGDGSHRCLVKKSGDKEVLLDTNLNTYSECLEPLIAILLSCISLAIDCEDSKMVEYYEDKPPVSESVVSQKAVKAFKDSDLIEQAKKYDTFEEFLKTLGNPVYHGTDAEFDTFALNKDPASGVRSEAVFFSKDRNVAQSYGSNVVEAVVSMKNPLEIDFEGASTVFFDGEWRTPSDLSIRISEINKDLANRYPLDEDLRTELENFGWSDSYADFIDGAVLKNIKDTGKYSELGSGTSENLLVSDLSLIKSMPELRSIWDKAHGKGVTASVQTIPIPPEFVSQTFYHGGFYEPSAIEDIFINGLKGRTSQGKAMLAPVKGSVYVAKSFDYALRYALGGDIAGSEDSLVAKGESPWGLVFLISGKVFTDVHPDEDAIGQLIYESYDGDTSLEFLRMWAEEYLTNKQLTEIKAGNLKYYAQGGKNLLDVLSPAAVYKLLDTVFAFANAGNLIVEGAYVLDRRHPELLKGPLDVIKDYMVYIKDFSEMDSAIAILEKQASKLPSKNKIKSSENTDMKFRLNAEKAAKGLLDELSVLHSNGFKNTLIGIEYGQFFFSITSDRFDTDQAPYIVKFIQSDSNVASFSPNSALPTITVYVASLASDADTFTDDVQDLSSFIYSNFIHEHIHLQDLRRNKTPQKGMLAENVVEYFNFPMEYDAYYQQALSSINRTLVNRLDQADILESFDSFKAFAVPFFNQGFLKNLTPETEKKLWKRLYRYFTDHDFAKYVDSFYGKASAKVPDELTDLAAVAMTSNSFQEFLSKVRQAHAGDVSNRELHRYSRGLGVYSEDEYVTVANIPVEFPEYLAMIYKSDKSLYNLITSDSDLITIYRAVPEDVVSIQFGDYVALKKSYAEMHLNSVITGQQGKPGKILKMSVPKSDVRWNGEDWSEWVYAPSDLTKQFHSLESFYKSVKDRPMPVTAKSDTGWSVPESLKAFSRNINSIENTSGWEAKTLLANSGGKVGDWTSVMYVLFNPATGELIPVSRHDEHQRGYELLYHLYKKYKLPRGKYVALCVNSYNYLMYESDKDLFLDAVKAWDALGGKQLVIEDVSKGSSYRFYSTDLENGIPAPAEKGSLSRDGSYIVDSLKQLTSLLKKLYTFPDDATVDRFNTLSVQFMNYLLEKFPIELGDVSTAISTAIPKIKSAPAGNFNEAAQAVFAHNGVKNLIHMKLRKAVDDKDSFEMRFLQLVFGDVALAKKMFDALNSDVITAKKKNKWEPYSDTETAKLSEKFGISFGKDKNGYFCYTHRARSESYDSVDKIPLKSLSFISSTGSDKGFKRHPVHPDDIMGCLPDYAPVATGKVSPETIIRKNMPSNGIVIGRKIIPVACLAPTENASIKDPEKVKAIATSMSAGKEIDPLLVEFNPYVTEGQTYQFPIVDGHHRYLGAIAAGKIDLPCVVIAQIQDFDCLRMENMSAVASADSDTAYMEAAESGDIETCSRMVKEAAERAGYNVGPVYHGTNSAKGFMVFDKAYQSSNENLRLGNGFYFTGLLSVATSYSNREGAAGSVLKFFLKISNPLKLNSISQFNAIVNKDLHKPITPNNPVLDYSEKIQKLGYDGILFYFNDSLWELVVYSPEQIKSADPITYDDSGAIIPLSNRFNSNSMDVRASKEDQLKKGEKVESEHDDTYKWIKDYYKKNGKFPTEEEVRKAIAEDHLSEIDNYYDLLQKMEKEAGV